MHVFIEDENGRRQVHQMSFVQLKQSAAVMDCFGRMIPQEGVDYDVEVVFKGVDNPSVSMYMIPHTDKGEWWKRYAEVMIKKYPPTVENPEEAIDESAANAENPVHPDAIIQPANASPTHDLEHKDAEVVS